MKNAGILFLTLLMFTACQEQPERYTQTSPEIDSLKAAMAAYEAGDWEGYKSHYADTAKIYHNTSDKFLSAADNANAFKETTAAYSSYGFVKDEGDIEMVVTDDGETWVNFWGVWEGTMTANNQTYKMPVHLTAQFIDGKVVKEYAYYDRSPIVLAQMEMQAAQEEASMEEDTEME
ncbi:MAG: hypothetical protein CL605_11265 [Altibacter sp.]|nr:hypothetical protein [Altibacter sp.]